MLRGGGERAGLRPVVGSVLLQDWPVLRSREMAADSSRTAVEVCHLVRVVEVGPLIWVRRGVYQLTSPRGTCGRRCDLRLRSAISQLDPGREGVAPVGMSWGIARRAEDGATAACGAGRIGHHRGGLRRCCTGTIHRYSWAISSSRCAATSPTVLPHGPKRYQIRSDARVEVENERPPSRLQWPTPRHARFFANALDGSQQRPRRGVPRPAPTASCLAGRAAHRSARIPPVDQSCAGGGHPRTRW